MGAAQGAPRRRQVLHGLGRRGNFNAPLGRNRPASCRAAPMTSLVQVAAGLERLDFAVGNVALEVP